MPSPLVAVTATTKILDGLPRVRLNQAYLDAVRAVGLVPVVVPPLDPTELAHVASAVRGVLLTGGEDVAPGEYGAEPSPRTDPPHRLRDRCEIALARLAHERRLPTLAICRGIQVANVALGGTLVQDIPSECANALKHDRADVRATRVHEVRVDAGSRLADALGATELSVNSSHHQSVAAPATGFRVVARAPDGIIEGAEWVGDDWWMLGVQWHPEELATEAKSPDRALFRAFAARVLA